MDFFENWISCTAFVCFRSFVLCGELNKATMAAQASTIATGCDSVVSLRRCVTSYSTRPRGIALSLSKSGLTFSKHRWNFKGTSISELVRLFSPFGFTNFAVWGAVKGEWSKSVFG
jgi:hypothetical protein